MKILVTGSSGFLGHAIRQSLIKEGYETYGTTRSRPPEDDREFQFDIVNDSCEAIFRHIEFDIIIHTIGLLDDSLPYQRLKRVNVIGTQKIIDYAKATHCKHFVQISSVSVYGFNMLGQNRAENSYKIRPHAFISKYARSKAQAERVVIKSGLPYTVLRLPMMIGKGDASVTPKLIDLLRENKILYFGTGKKLISVMPVCNLCPLISIIVREGATNEIYHPPSFHIPLNAFVEEHSSLAGHPYTSKKAKIRILFKKLSNITKILLIYSWRGADFQDSKIRKKINQYRDLISWKEAIRINFNASRSHNAKKPIYHI